MTITNQIRNEIQMAHVIEQTEAFIADDRASAPGTLAKVTIERRFLNWTCRIPNELIRSAARKSFIECCDL
jgi:hypothetical protein